MKKKSVVSFLLVMSLLLLSTFNLYAEGQKEKTSENQNDTPILEVWWAGVSQFKKETPDNPFVKRVIEEINIGWERPTVSWNSGNDYAESLKLRLVAADAPDIYRLPNFGFSIAELAEGGAAADLTELLPKYAPTLYNSVPKEIWNVVKYESPEGDKLYYIPVLRNAPTHGAFIRKDWLDRVGLGLPETKDDFYTMLRAFRDQDANGNGDPNDEIPTGGRGPGRWWDHLFTPYGVAMVEGFPTWDYYDGKIQYSAVQPEMKTALIELKKAYDEGLIDPEVLINPSNTWRGKYQNDEVGIFFHMPINLFERVMQLYPSFPEAEWIWFPPYSVPGVDAKWSEGYVGSMNTNEKIIISNGDEETVINALKLLEHLQQDKIIEQNLWGIEGIHYTVENGKKVKRIDNLEEQQSLPMSFAVSPAVTTTSYWKNISVLSLMAIEDKTLFDRAMNTVDKVFSDAKVLSVPGTNLPQSIYNGYPDISTHKLYFSTMAKILIGEKDIDEFDDFVKKWYATGGDEVTKKAQEAAKKLGL